MSGYERRKGAVWEREGAQALRVLFPSARRGLSQVRSGREEPDIEGTPYWVEAKRG